MEGERERLDGGAKSHRICILTLWISLTISLPASHVTWLLFAPIRQHHPSMFSEEEINSSCEDTFTICFFGPLIFLSLTAKCDPFWKVFQRSLWHWPSINLPLFWDVWVDYHTAARAQGTRGGRCIPAAPAVKPLRPVAFFSFLLPSFHLSSSAFCPIKQETGYSVLPTEGMNVGEAEWVWHEEMFLHVSVGGIWEVHLKPLAVPPSLTFSAWTVTFHEQKSSHLSNYHI